MKPTVLMRKRPEKSLAELFGCLWFANAAVLVLSTSSLEERGHQSRSKRCSSRTMLQLVPMKLEGPSTGCAEVRFGELGGRRAGPRRDIWELLRNRLPSGKAVAYKMKLALDL